MVPEGPAVKARVALSVSIGEEGARDSIWIAMTSSGLLKPELNIAPASAVPGRGFLCDPAKGGSLSCSEVRPPVGLRQTFQELWFMPRFFQC